MFVARRVQVTRGSFGAALRQKVGVEAQVTRGGPGAAPGWAAGAGAAGHVVAPELPGTCTRGYLVCRVPTADRADVPDREIGKILPIGKMIVLFIFRSNFQ